MPPLAFSDSEISQLIDAASPLPCECRDNLSHNSKAHTTLSLVEPSQLKSPQLLCGGSIIFQLLPCGRGGQSSRPVT